MIEQLSVFMSAVIDNYMIGCHSAATAVIEMVCVCV